MVTAVNEVSLIIKVEKKDKFEVKMGTVSGMTEVCCANHQIYCKVINGEIQVTSYRGNKPGWENITGKWLEYAKQLTARKLPEEFMAMLGMSSDDKPIANVNDCLDGGDSAGDSAVSTVVNTVTIADDARSGAEVLKDAISKNPKHVQEKVNMLGGYKDSTEGDCEEKMNEIIPEKNADGSYTLVCKNNIEVRTIAMRINESNNVVPHIYLHSSVDGYISKMVAIPASNIINGGTKLKNELKNMGGFLTDGEINLANNILHAIVVDNKISIIGDASLSYSDILRYFKDYITEHLNKRYDETNGDYCPSVIVEKKDNGSIVIGIRNRDFDDKYAELMAESEMMNERMFKKQGKLLGDLIPDAGRGGGDHILGDKYYERYYGTNRTNLQEKKKKIESKERIQRIKYPDNEAEELWEKEAEFRTNHPELLTYVPELEVQS